MSNESSFIDTVLLRGIIHNSYKWSLIKPLCQAGYLIHELASDIKDYSSLTTIKNPNLVQQIGIRYACNRYESWKRFSLEVEAMARVLVAERHFLNIDDACYYCSLMYGPKHIYRLIKNILGSIIRLLTESDKDNIVPCVEMEQIVLQLHIDDRGNNVE